MVEMMKVALLYAFRKSEWNSCISITDNLRKSYAQIDVKTKDFDYDHLKGELHLEDLSDSVKDFEPDLIVFLDHRPTPKHILPRLLKRKVIVPLLIHVYGDFSVVVILKLLLWIFNMLAFSKFNQS